MMRKKKMGYSELLPLLEPPDSGETMQSVQGIACLSG